MTRVIVIGDGPAGLSAALFLAKTGNEVVVFAQDQTAMHYALLRNYLGVDEETGTDFQKRARAKVAGFGAEFVDEEVTELSRDEGGFRATTSGGEHRGDFAILAGGRKSQRLAEEVGAEADEQAGVAHDTEFRTTVDGLYAVGRVARPHRSQAIISAGAGATAALDILARVAGEDVTNWDSPEDEDDDG